MILILLWLLLGSIGLNVMWIQTHKINIATIEKLSKANKKFDKIQYLKGFLFGLMLGPLTCFFILKKIIKSKQTYRS